MTASELIAELSKHPPGKEVRVCLRSVHMADEAGDWEQWLSEMDAMRANEVRNEGAFLLIWGAEK
ncbi:hypothetical protein [Hydrogenophaga sp. T2]|uniref:hypothetical protein n=1 Tax=Hydrogenophaga sp. T2 TaxID=3132823 RepID=UPI003CF9D8E8